jgi:leucyl aminopeptidase
LLDKSSFGKKSAVWLHDQLLALGSKKHGYSVKYFEHAWGQNSVIARIEGSGKYDDIVIMSAHLDSVNQWNPYFGRSPGADDDGSGFNS